MNVQVSIVGLLQRVDLDSGTVSNMLELAFGDGTRLTVPIGEREAEHILHLSVRAVPPTRNNEDELHIFGDAPADDTVQEDLLDTPDALAAALASRMSPPAQRAARASMYTTRDGVSTMFRTVASVDEAGNPLIPGLQSQQEEMDTGLDEDGVPSA